MAKNNRNQWGEILKLITIAFLVIASTVFIFSAVSLTPASSQASSVEAEVLAAQLEFILKMNSAFLGFLGIIGALLTWFFKNNLEDAKAVAAKMVREELDQHIQARVKEEFRYWEMSARTERVIGQTLVNYYLPNGVDEPHEFDLVRNRGFRQVLFCSRTEEVRSASADVVIFDAQNWKTEQGERVVSLTDRGWLADTSEQQVKHQIDVLRAIIGSHVVLVVYVRGIVAYLNDAKFEKVYVLPANNQVTLLGHTVNGAYVAYGDRRSQGVSQ